MKPANLIPVLLYAAWFLGFSGVWFVVHLRKYLRWRRQTPISGQRQAVLILLPALLIAALLGLPLTAVPGALPAAQEELLEVTAPVESVRQYTYRRNHGQYGGFYNEYRYYIYLQDHTGSLFIPENFGFDQEAFLAWAGIEPVVFRYAYTDGHTTVYEIRNGEGDLFLTYDHAQMRLWQGAMHDLITLLSGILFLGAGAVYLPAFLYPLKGNWKKQRQSLILLALLILALIAVSAIRRPKVSDTPAGGPPPVVVAVQEGIPLRLELPQGWTEGGKTANDQWYQVQSHISTCFHFTKCSADLTQGIWRQAYRADYRSFLLETYITAPQTDLGPFLQTLQRSDDKVPGTSFWVSEGWGASESGAKNHFLVVLLPDQGALLAIQSCTSSNKVTWGELEQYADEYVWPLLAVLPAQAAEGTE